MAIQKVNKDFSPKVREIKYLAKTFPEFRQNLIDFAQVYFPNTYSDFNESSVGMMFIEMASAVGDVLSYYIDNQFKENLIAYAEELPNLIAISQALGYKVKPATSAATTLDLFQLVPAMGSGSNFQPDPRYYLKIDANAVVSSVTAGSINFRTTDRVDFSDETNRQITVYSVDNNNAPLTYLAQKQVQATAGDIKTVTQVFGTAQKFSVITLPETNVLGIIDVVDSNGNNWYEVDYLAQDIIFNDLENLVPATGSTQSLPPQFLMQLQTQPRRFVTRYNKNFQLELHFGSGVTDDSSEDVSLDVNKIASNEFLSRVGSTALDPADFLDSTSYGLAPSNTTLTIRYIIGGGLQSNVASNTLTKIASVNVLNDTTVFSKQELSLYNSTVASLASNNPESATGGKNADSAEEIRQNALAFFNAQNRVVTRQDYIARCYAMPPRYGSVAKAFVVQDDQINGILRATTTGVNSELLATDMVNPSAVNLYVLGYDNNQNLVTLNDQTKQNLKVYLSQYKMLTDQINILDAFVINLGINFKIIVFKNYNMNDVLARCLDTVKSFFDINKWSINQPIIINDLYLQIAQVDGVQSVLSVDIINKYQYKNGVGYSQFLYDIAGATDNGVVYPSLDPSIFAINFPDVDIVGNAIQ